MEETTTGVIRLRAMEKDGVLKLPVIAVNDAETKHFFDNRYGTGQSTLDGVIRATDMLLAGRNGWSSAATAGAARASRMRARGMGAHVIVTEVDPIRALEAAMDGFQVIADRRGRQDRRPVHHRHRQHPRHPRRALRRHEGRRDDLQLGPLQRRARPRRAGRGSPSTVNKGVREFVDEYVMADGRKLYVLGEGRLINLAAAHGHPASVMDMSFAAQALATEWSVKQKGKLEHKVYDVPKAVDQWVATLKLQTHGHRHRHPHRRADQVPRQLGNGHLIARIGLMPDRDPGPGRRAGIDLDPQARP